MRRFLKKLHRYYFLILLALSFILLYPLIYFFSRSPVNFKRMNSVRWAFSFISTSLAGIFYRFHYEKEVDWTKTYVICSNHTSNLDITAVMLLARNNMVFMGKEELLDNFITGIYFRTIDIPLNRDSKMSAFRAFKKAEESIKAGKHVVIFPEGMISEHYPPVLQPFKNGPFKLSIDQGVAILPVSIHNNWELMWDDGARYGSKPGICDIYIHAPVETAGMLPSDAENLKNHVFDMMQERLSNYRKT
jgi:1-acyl-sn-glycerol-3-phosphate acyltransferase